MGESPPAKLEETTSQTGTGIRDVAPSPQATQAPVTLGWRHPPGPSDGTTPKETTWVWMI